MYMLNVKLLVIGLVSIMSGTALAETITVKEVAVSVMDAYIPSDITISKEAYVVVNGLFPNSCYTLAGAEVKHLDDFNHQVRTIAKVRSGICLRVLVPYNKEISLGLLQAGEHKIKFAADDDTYFEKAMIVK